MEPDLDLSPALEGSSARCCNIINFAAWTRRPYAQSSAILDGKTRKLKSLRKESDKAKIILLSFFHLVRN